MNRLLKKDLPSIGVVIPTYNSEQTLSQCLESIMKQTYPKEKIEVIIADGGSKDGTLEIARQFRVNKILHNPLRTGEAGKAEGVKAAKNDIIALIDSDNILPTKEWLKLMMKPFEDEETVGAEPLYYAHRKEDGYITRYCALIGMNDPLCLFIGNYDRYSLLTGKWTELDVKQEDKGDYVKIELDQRAIPTMGANGFLIRRDMLDRCSIGHYLFDVDVVYELVKQGRNKFAKVKIGIVHIFSSSISAFARKQRRRIYEYAYYKELGLRKYPWSTVRKSKILKFVGYTVFTLPILAQVIVGYAKKADAAWFFHILACWITLLIYAFATIRHYLFGARMGSGVNG